MKRRLYGKSLRGKTLLAGLVVSGIISVACPASLKVPMPSAETDFYSHEGVRIHFKDTGAGSPVVLLHGFGTSLDTWRFLVEPLESEYRVVRVDLKGHGFSGRPRDQRYAVEDHARIVLGLIRDLKLQDVVLVGHSYGSVVAVAAALESRDQMPGMISGLALIAGSLDRDNLPLVLRVLRAPLVGWLTLRLTSAAFRTRLMLKRTYYDNSKVTDSLVELYAKYQRIPGTEYALLRTAEQVVPSDFMDLEGELRKLDVPVINVWGREDRVIKEASARSVCRLLPRCEFTALEDVGHVPQEEAPEKVLPLLLDFLRTGKISFLS